MNLNVEVHVGTVAQTLEEVHEHFGGHLPNHFAVKLRLPHKPAPSTKVKCHSGVAVVHRQHEAISLYASLASEGFVDGLAQGNGSVLYGVVLIYVEVAVHMHAEVDARMAANLVEHVVEETYAGGDVGLPGAVEVDGYVDLGFGCVAGHMGFALTTSQKVGDAVPIGCHERSAAGKAGGGKLRPVTLLLSGTAVEFNPNGTAKADPVTYQTAEADIFVGGDAFTGQKFAIDAIAAGKQGAVSLHRFVQGATLTIGRDRRQFIELDKKSALIAVDSYDNTPRQRVGYNEALRNTFRDERVAFTAQQVRAETARCLGCGASIVDPNKCIGCGVCTTKCAFDAIHLHRERPECSTMYKCEDKMKTILPYMVKREIKIKKAARRAKKSK